jgi:aerobic-type carbon monoxide dehydrogenase small subunit (CoxS/CutS family)
LNWNALELECHRIGEPRAEQEGEMQHTIRFTLNGAPVALETAAERSLLWVLRTDLALTGTKYGCGMGLCGSCTVIVDGRVARACQTTLGSVAGKEVTTIEGLARDGRLHPLQQAFWDVGGFQCGYCTPGMIVNAYGLLLENPRPTRAEIVAGMESNLCRCSAYTRIVEAIEVAAATMEADHD